MSIPDMQFGWVRNEKEVEKHLPTLPGPLFGDSGLTLDDRKEVFLWDVSRKIMNGKELPKGPQGIGDCVSWGSHNFVNDLACVQIFNKLKSMNLLHADDEDPQKQAVLEEYQEAATEVIYALSRVEVGGQRGSYSDGSTGVWAMKAISTFGTLSRKYLDSKGLGGAYDKNRAKDWGAKGLPDSLEPDARNHLVKSVSLITSFEQAAASIQNGYGVVVCSDQGFTMTRDKQGFCSPRGVWYHCMYLRAVRWDRPGLCCSQSWGANTPDGPLDKGQPDNTFWIDANVVNRMLSQRDSYTGSQFDGYPAQDLIDWRH